MVYMQTSNEMFLNWIKDGMSLKVYVHVCTMFAMWNLEVKIASFFFTTSLNGENPRLVGPSKRPNQMGLKVGPHLELKQN